MEHDRVTEGCWNQEELLSRDQVPHQEIEGSHPEEQDETVGAALLGKSDVIGHEGKSECTWEGDPPGELFCQEKDHRDRERSENQRQNPEVSLRFRKRIKKMREQVEKRRMEEGRLLFIILELRPESISRILIGVNFIEPEGFTIKTVKSQRKSDQQKQRNR